MFLDTDDALITIDIHIVESPNGGEPIQIACVTFNNLDVIGMYIFIFLYIIYICNVLILQRKYYYLILYYI